MMRDDDKPFICVKTRWSLSIRPRNAAGWRAMAWWLLPLIVATLIHGWLLVRWHGDPVVPVITITLVAFVLGWAFNMIRWMLARSVVITPGEPPQSGRR